MAARIIIELAEQVFELVYHTLNIAIARTTLVIGA